MHPVLLKSRARQLVAVAVSALLVMLVGPITGSAAKVGTRSFGKVTKVATINPTARAAQGQAEPGTATEGEFRPRPRKVESQISGSKSAAHVPSKNVPRPAVSRVNDGTGTFGFNGLNHFDNRTAGSGSYANTQFSLEPPDQALCVSDVFVVESVNTVIRVRSKAGASLTPAIPINQFFGLPPSISRTTSTFGPFTADPKCYWDANTGAWFVTILSLDVNPRDRRFHWWQQRAAGGEHESRPDRQLEYLRDRHDHRRQSQ